MTGRVVLVENVCSPYRHLNALIYEQYRQSTYQLVTVNRHILCVSLCVSPCLALSVQGKWGIEMPHRNLLVMERTYYRYIYLQDG